MTDLLSEIDRRIVGALQLDGRAPWSAVAKALGEPLRTVARRGRDLLETGTVRVVGLANLGPTCVIEITCAPNRIEALARELAEHPGVVYLLVLANPSSLLVEVHEKSFDLATMTLHVIPSFEGVQEISATPVLRYFKTNAQWRPGLLVEQESKRLAGPQAPEESTAESEQLGAPDQAIVDALEVDGRASVAELAARAGITEPTARRRLNELQSRGAVAIRALVDPRCLGFPVEACLRIACSPIHADDIGAKLAAVPEVRYVAQVLGEYSLVAHVNSGDLPRLRAMLTGPWTADVRSLRASLVTRVYKRSGHSVPVV